jgi:hypothetical protein
MLGILKLSTGSWFTKIKEYVMFAQYNKENWQCKIFLWIYLSLGNNSLANPGYTVKVPFSKNNSPSERVHFEHLLDIILVRILLSFYTIKNIMSLKSSKS